MPPRHHSEINQKFRMTSTWGERGMIFYIILLVHFGASISSQSESYKWDKQLTRKRLLKEYKDIKIQKISIDVPFNSSSDECGIRLLPLKNNILEWHFSFTGVKGTPYESGVYHGRILLHPEYPRKAPAILMLTPNGRWEVDKPICLSATSFHQETWDSKWTLRTLVMAVREHMTTYPREIGSILTSVDRQQALAHRSRIWRCSCCHCSTRHGFLLGEELHTENFPVVSLPTNSLNKKDNSIGLRRQQAFGDVGDAKKVHRGQVRRNFVSKMIRTLLTIALVTLHLWLQMWLQT